jgi:hypothetical protein
MASIKISELTALTPPAAADELAVVDVSASSTKKTTVGEVVGIINGDVEVASNGTATISELPVSKLADGAARQLLQTDAAGTGVEWTSNVDIPGTLDVTGASTFDSTLSVAGVATFDASGNVNFTAAGLKVTTGRNISATAANSNISIFGGDIATNTGANIELYGGSHATLANLMILDAGEHRFRSADGSSERARIDSSGRLLVGAPNGVSAAFVNSSIQAHGATGDASSLTLYRFTTSATAAATPRVVMARSGSDSKDFTVVANGNRLGQLNFVGADGTQFISAASIDCEVDGTPGANDMPGRIVFGTTADGASSPTERMRISQDGTVTIGKASADLTAAGTYVTAGGALAVTRSNATPLLVNRLASDGTLAIFYQDSTQEGDISVSGTTVSYNGAHLSRWSQLPGGANRIDILRGSVLSSINEMCEWGNEDNEQLNRMKVSDIEGDKNVSGVFQAWDDNDDTYTNDFYCAMTGDFIIRIAEGVTVERGDLLMSAGDGTAKPQDDDIIRSKTVAKVTSTHVTCTYDDGSYCVPCVLMAC